MLENRGTRGVYRTSCISRSKRKKRKNSIFSFLFFVIVWSLNFDENRRKPTAVRYIFKLTRIRLFAAPCKIHEDGCNVFSPVNAVFDFDNIENHYRLGINTVA